MDIMDEKLIQLKTMLDRIYDITKYICLKNHKLAPEEIKDIVEKRNYCFGYQDGYNKAVEDMKEVLDKDLAVILEEF